MRTEKRNALVVSSAGIATSALVMIIFIVVYNSNYDKDKYKNNENKWGIINTIDLVGIILMFIIGIVFWLYFAKYKG